jgi:ATP-dependent Clp protease ATP-binding subunit ClpA
MLCGVFPGVFSLTYLSSESEAAGNKHWLVPRGVNKLFTGRSEIIDKIKEAISDDSTQHADKQKVFVITGLGGMGKTEICLQVANILREE